MSNNLDQLVSEGISRAGIEKMVDRMLQQGTDPNRVRMRPEHEYRPSQRTYQRILVSSCGTAFPEAAQ